MSMCSKIMMMFLALATAFGAPLALAKGPDFSIFEVRRQLALSNDEKTEKDFYIYAGTEEGVKPGFVYDVVRNVPLYDGYQNRSLGEITIKVAQVKVIYADKNVSVARYHKEFSRAALPVLKENFILLGDTIDLSSQAKSAEVGPAVTPEAPQMGPPQKPAESVVRLFINSVDMTEAAYNP